MHSKIIIIGAGLSGLLIGYRLKLAGIPFKIIEARNRIGGRIHTILSDNSNPLEMGATWFADEHNNLKSLLAELDLNYFKQYVEGTSFFQAFSSSPPNAITIPNQPTSYRIVNGTSSIIKKLANQIGENNILLNSTVELIKLSENILTIVSNNVTFTADKVVLALPPKLWANNIHFEPSLPNNLLDTAINTHTWMEDSIKVAMSYDSPFWRKNGQSGTLISNSGPITEFYDHCNFEANKYALCGFMNPNYSKLISEERKKLVLDQVVKVFGFEAKNISTYKEVIWEKEDKTSSINIKRLFAHQNNGHPSFRSPYYNNRLFISSSEAAAKHPGYMEGAVISAKDVFDHILAENH
jgi:monoamine oxidase|tara:strand:- start:61 stop:1119 length:1059 start_codon:yes stop_codon:yes gene_type:complete